MDEFIQEEEGQTPFLGQTIVLDKFLAWEKEKRPDNFDEVIYNSSIIPPTHYYNSYQTVWNYLKFLQDLFRRAFKLRNSLFEIERGEYEEFAILRRLPGTAGKSLEPVRYFHFEQRPQIVKKKLATTFDVLYPH